MPTHVNSNCVGMCCGELCCAGLCWVGLGCHEWWCVIAWLCDVVLSGVGGLCGVFGGVNYCVGVSGCAVPCWCPGVGVLCAGDDAEVVCVSVGVML